MTKCLAVSDICSHVLGLRILTQPKNLVCQPGDKLVFSVETSKTAQAYQWCLNASKITSDNKDYEGCISEKLFINGCLPKHKGSYQCILMTELDTYLSTEIATLKIGMCNWTPHWRISGVYDFVLKCKNLTTPLRNYTSWFIN